MEFLHVGMKVKDIYKSSALYGELFGIEWEPIKEYVGVGTTIVNGEAVANRTLVTHGKTASGFEIEMIQSVAGSSADDLILEGREGLSHFAFLVDDLPAATAAAEQSGLKAVNEYRSDYVDFTFVGGEALGGALVQLVHFNRPRVMNYSKK